MTALSELASVILVFARMVVFALAIGLTLISFQAYREKPSDRLEAAFIGFAFLSMGFAMTVLSSQTESLTRILQIAETVPFIVGFGMLYVSLYR